MRNVQLGHGCAMRRTSSCAHSPVVRCVFLKSEVRSAGSENLQRMEGSTDCPTGRNNPQICIHQNGVSV